MLSAALPRVSSVVNLSVVVALYNCLILLGNEVPTFEDGGWVTNQSSSVRAGAGPCNVDVVDTSLTQRDFIAHYAFKKPVVIQKVKDNENFKKLCSKNSLLQQHGDTMVRLSSANTYSYEKVDVQLKTYLLDIMQPQTLDMLGNETLYWFGDNDEKWHKLFQNYKAPPYYLPGMSGAFSFGVAATGTGVPFHFHGPGFAEVIYGKKRWFMYPPDKKPPFHPNRTTLQWLYDEYPNLDIKDRPLECTVGPNEVIYFPHLWWHATLNIDTCVFISTFLSPS